MMNLSENKNHLSTIIDVATFSNDNIPYTIPYQLKVYYFPTYPENKIAAEETFWNEYGRLFRIDNDRINEIQMNVVAIKNSFLYLTENISLGYPRK